MKKCYEVMTANPLTCLPTETAQQAAQKMRDADAGPIPVVEGRESARLLGIVTDRDLALRVVAEGKDPGSTTVADVMTTDVASVNRDDNVEKAIDLMKRHQVRRIPVLAENGALVGIIAQADIALRVSKDAVTGEVVERISH